MFDHPIFEYLAIVLMTVGILVTTLIHTLVGLAAGLVLVTAGVGILLIHYRETGTDPDLFS